MRSARLRNWNYGSDAIYFVTICTQGRECFFGEITNIDINMTHDCRDVMHRVSANKPVTTNNIVTNTEYKNTFAPQSKNLASIIRGFKSSVTINARKINANFGWQSRFHDHIIRNEESFQRI
ncbi:MAG: hypothetical protein GZ094_10835 [Mariniphaga sp.]|nr:hypothetical protein [Mariniphaga sp.]